VTAPEEATRIFEAQRPRLVRLAYRMLGSLAEAEDVVQDAWLRWRKVDQAVDAPAAFLSQIVTRLCLDVMKSARSRRESYFGAWLPEPLLGTADRADEPEDDLSLTLMMALERLSPLERAAFLLHDVFGVPLREVAVTLDREPAAVRQLAARARRHVRAARPRYPVAREEGDRIAAAFFAATQSGDVATLRTILSETVVLQSDGGGKVLAFRNPILGLEKLLRLYRGLRRKGLPQEARLIRPVWIDGLPGYVTLERGQLLQTTAFAIEDGRITNIYITRNPDKLRLFAEALGKAQER